MDKNFIYKTVVYIYIGLKICIYSILIFSNILGLFFSYIKLLSFLKAVIRSPILKAEE